MVPDDTAISPTLGFIFMQRSMIRVENYMVCLRTCAQIILQRWYRISRRPAMLCYYYEPQSLINGFCFYNILKRCFLRTVRCMVSFGFPPSLSPSPCFCMEALFFFPRIIHFGLVCGSSNSTDLSRTYWCLSFPMRTPLLVL